MKYLLRSLSIIMTLLVSLGAASPAPSGLMEQQLVQNEHRLNASVAIAASSSFVKRQGSQLFLNGKPYRPIGYNQYRLTSMPGGYICDGSYGPMTDAQLNMWFDDMKSAGATIVRTWFFQSYYWGSLNRWDAFDRVLNAAVVRRMKVVPVLVNHWPDCEPSTGPKNLAFYETGYTQPNTNGYPLSFREYARTVAAHYANNPTVAYWQLVNEAETPNNGSCSPETEQAGARALRAFTDDITGVIKSVASKHLVSLGVIGEGNCGTAGEHFLYVHAGAVDICTVHDYSHATEAMPGDQWNGLQVRINQCNEELNKPIVVDEAGIAADVSEEGSSSGVITPETLARRAHYFNAKITAQFAAGVNGYLVWEKILERSDSTFNLSSGRYGVGPGDPTEAVIRNWSRNPEKRSSCKRTAIGSSSGSGSVPFGSRVCSPDRTLYAREVELKDVGMLGVYNRQTRQLLRVLDVSQHPEGDFPAALKGLAWRFDSKFLAALFHHGSGGHASIVNVDTGEEIASLSFETFYHSVRFTSDGKAIQLKNNGLGDILTLPICAFGQCGSESVTLLSPPNAACEDLTVEFQWQIENRNPTSTYCAELITDKGSNPWDGAFEDSFPAGNATEIQVSLDPFFYDPARFEWGIKVTLCNNKTDPCPCTGKALTSDIRILRTSSTSSQPPACN